MWSKIKKGWMAFVDVLGRVQTTLLLSIIYHIAVGPIALVARLLRRDFLGLRARPGESYAAELGPLSTTPERAHRQF
ncbi:hypothetical protein L6Q96_12685 [Candidatus Binatia bacterium]|nr:hypothetical protein [Candidatus Binatia bacterium]